MKRSIIPGLDLQFESPAVSYDHDRDVVCFFAKAGAEGVRCAVSREVLENHFGADGLDRAGRLRVFREYRPNFERFARTKYLTWPIEEPGSVLITTDDVHKLGHSSKRFAAP